MGVCDILEIRVSIYETAVRQVRCINRFYLALHNVGEG